MNVAAGRVYSSLLEQADTLVAQRDSHIVALYKAGGSLALYASALRSGDPASLRQVPYLNGIVTSDADSAASALACCSVCEGDARRHAEPDRHRAFEHGRREHPTCRSPESPWPATGAPQPGVVAGQESASLEGRGRSTGCLAGRRPPRPLRRPPPQRTPLAAPANYKALFQAAAQTCPGLSWTVLAAIGQVETHDGMRRNGVVGRCARADAVLAARRSPSTRATATTTARPTSWTRPIPSSPQPPTCARMAPDEAETSLSTAIWNYNHADWYVELVESLPAKIS